MAATDFHLFGNLPAELQCMIWDSAVRSESDVPSAHSFSTFHEAEAAPAGTQYSCIGLDELAEEGTQLALSSDGISVCTHDSGLWTACIDSRYAMERRYQSAHWKAQAAEPREREEESCEDEEAEECAESETQLPEHASATFPVSVSSGDSDAAQYMTIHPRRDLLIFEPANLATADWNALLNSGLVPFMSYDHGLGPTHFGIRFDDEWADGKGVKWGPDLGAGYYLHRVGGSLQSVGKLLNNIESMGERQLNLFMIDYRLKRRQQPQSSEPEEIAQGHDNTTVPDADATTDESAVKPQPPKPQVFNANGRRFVEVLSQDDLAREWELPEGSRTVFDFKEYLDRAAMTASGPHGNSPSPTVAIRCLACEFDE